MNSTLSCAFDIRNTRLMLGTRRLSPVGQFSAANGGASFHPSLTEISLDVANEASPGPEGVLRSLLDEAHAQLRDARRALEALTAQLASPLTAAGRGTANIAE